ncbi:MAG TPA: sigma 54-interacting transcriptional regulator [Bdellovibrionota bacterium]|nr:sigma 54-interacting transcriptional regulator [Bdellovibrionota bacterium]
MIELAIRKGDEEMMKYLLKKETTTIGRSNQNDICLPDATVSRVHLTILRQGDQYLATDRSTNGTFVNNKRITSHELKPNDQIRVGNWTIIFGSTVEEPEEKTVVLSDRDPTRVLSFRPEKNELVFERALLERMGTGTPPYPIGKSIVTIGKSKANDIVITDEFVSTFHCKIENRKGIFYLKDLGSTNGTLLNGQKVIETALPFNSTIEIGQTKLRLFSLQEVRTVEAMKDSQFEGIHSNSPRMREVFSLIARVATSDTTVLIQGETGAGKELVARALHNQSGRSGKSFVAINCGAISRDLVESELFGHEKGAFTSAHQQHRGVFEQANGGTLFLDEVGELPLDLQPKLLRVLETGEIKRVGGTQLIDVDVRVVAATNRDLAGEVRKGKFREDLFFRLFVVPIKLPPLRERPEDIPLLVNHFLKQELASSKSRALKKVEPAAMDRLVDYPWPGNIRELKNVISRAVLECKTDTIGPGDLQFTPLGVRDLTAHDFNEDEGPAAVSRSLKDVERDRILTELRRNRWNKKATAKVLGIAKSTLHEKIRKYNIQED